MCLVVTPPYENIHLQQMWTRIVRRLLFQRTRRALTRGVTRDSGHPEPAAKDLCPGWVSRTQQNLSACSPPM
jgi:hypothetical protein